MSKRNDALATTSQHPWGLPAPRAPMPTMSIDVIFDLEEEAKPSSSHVTEESGVRIRTWCSED
jgi:hypothetical protein